MLLGFGTKHEHLGFIYREQLDRQPLRRHKHNNLENRGSPQIMKIFIRRAECCKRHGERLGGGIKLKWKGNQIQTGQQKEKAQRKYNNRTKTSDGGYTMKALTGDPE